MLIECPRIERSIQTVEAETPHDPRGIHNSNNRLYLPHSLQSVDTERLHSEPAQNLRPLGGFSEYMATQFAHQLGENEPQRALRDGYDQFLRKIGTDIAYLEGTPRELSLAMLELTMFGAAMKENDLEIPFSLSAGLAQLSTRLGVPPEITYGTVVRSNPLSEPRTWCSGDYKQPEADFYRGHEIVERLAEVCLDNVLTASRILNRPKGGKSTQDRMVIEGALDQAIEHFQAIPHVVHRYLGSLTSHQFQQFRPFFKGIHDSIPGASGIFSANMTGIRLALFGSSPQEHLALTGMGREELRLHDRVQFVRRFFHLFPKEDQPRLRSSVYASERGSSLFDLCEQRGYPRGIATRVYALAGLVLEDMEAHLDLVKRILPEVFSGGGLGTAGTVARDYLGGGVYSVRDTMAGFANEVGIPGPYSGLPKIISATDHRSSTQTYPSPVRTIRKPSTTNDLISKISIGNSLYRVNFGEGIDITIPVRTDDTGVKAFHLPRAEERPLPDEVLDAGFSGSVREGASCNCTGISFYPHTGGTHVEGPGHVNAHRTSLSRHLSQHHFPALLISVTPEQIADDQIITRKLIEEAIQTHSLSDVSAIVIRTLPNGDDKLHRDYSGTNPPFLAPAATRYLAEQGISQLVVDLPSVDQEVGDTVAHREFFGNQPTDQSTITEFVHVPNEVPDGMYLLNLQVAQFQPHHDAWPASVELFPLEPFRVLRGSDEDSVHGIDQSNSSQLFPQSHGLSSLAAQAEILDRFDPTRSVRAELIVSPGSINVEGHTLGAPIRNVLEAGERTLEQWGREGVEAWFTGESNTPWRDVMEKEIQPGLAHVLGCDPDDAVVMDSLTNNLGTALRMLHPSAIASGRPDIVTLKGAFPSDVDAIRAQLSYHPGLGEENIHYLTPSPDSELFSEDTIIENLEQLQSTAGICVLEHQPYRTGQVLDIQKIASSAKELGYWLIVDAAHSAGAYPLDLNSMGADIAIGCGYKYLMAGPGTAGWIWTDLENLHRQAAEKRGVGIWTPGGWWGRSGESRFQFNSGERVPDRGARSLQVSTPSPTLLNMWAASLNNFRSAGEMAEIHLQALQRGDMIISALKAHPSFGERFDLVTPTDHGQRGTEIVFRFKELQDCKFLGEWLRNPTDGGTGIRVDVRPSEEAESTSAYMRLGPHPFLTSNQDAVHIADRMFTALDHQAS